MKNIIKNFLFKAFSPQNIKLITLTFFAIFMMVSNLSAQSDPGDDPDVPIDGGLSLLIAAGVGYGAKQLRKKKAAANKN